MTMNAREKPETDPIDLCHSYIEAWNQHDGAAILQTFASGGRYTDPLSGGAISGMTLRAYAESLWSAFPDLQFKAEEPIFSSPDRLILPWTMSGTNTGSMNGLPPSAKPVSVDGMDLIRTVSDGIAELTGYFDSAAVPRQLGLQVIVQPHEIGPVQFGTSSVIRTSKPIDAGAVGFTELIARSDAEVAEVQSLGRHIAADMLEEPGFISLTTSVVGRRMTTMSTWESEQSLQAAMSGSAHVDAMRRFLGVELAEGGATSVWSVVRASQFRRCRACRRMRRLEGRAGRCSCGEALETVV